MTTPRHRPLKSQIHRAPYPKELAERLIRMFSFVGDTVLDPFRGTGTTTVAAMHDGSNSIGFEIDKTSAEAACKKIENSRTLEMTTEIVINDRTALLRDRFVFCNMQ